ncbi:hypothetical protein M231_07230 [Tremella mesenterica]|uniref:Actin interacting protein 3 C-terminal domain-containing protein n=1 Tax=Tremella mesenterica TaxID=5217 RepID=A0A4Q1B9N0_TREME|nr:hypothetical protein M231_07230 [Tremella mesenterica]
MTRRPDISYPLPVASSSSMSLTSSQSREGDMNWSNGPRRSSMGGSRVAPAALDSIITRLLVTTKQMLQGLDQWSQGIITEEDVSDIYVRLGNGFEQCVEAFQKVGLDTTELSNIPQELRICLEQALAEDPDPQTLTEYYPQIRSIIYDLLNGLKIKQAAYKRLLAERNGVDISVPRPALAPSPFPSTQPPPPAQNRLPSGDPSVSRTMARSPTPGPGSASSPPNRYNPLPSLPSSSALADRQSSRSGLPARPAPPDAFRPPRTRPVDPPPQPLRRSLSPLPMEKRFSSSPPSISDPTQLVRHQLTDEPPPRSNLLPTPPSGRAPPRPDRASRDSLGGPRPVSRFSLDSEMTNGSPVRSPPSNTPERRGVMALSTSFPNTSSEESIGPPILPILNLPSSTSLDFSHPSPPSGMPEVPPETRATLAALQRSDALERRASKRFSSYTFNKMLPTTEPTKKVVGSPQRPMRRADRPPPMPALPESSKRSSNAQIKIPSPLAPPISLRTNGNTPSSSRSDTSSPAPDVSALLGYPDSSMRVLRTPDSGEIGQEATPRPGDGFARQSDMSSPSPRISVYLQIGRQVKKATLDLPVDLSSLKLMFMERFEYDPGMEDFPDVYIRDPRTGVQFELEDMDELKEGCILNLNIEPLDQVKQHFDTTVATLMQEIKEMRSAVEQSSRASITPSSSALLAAPTSQPVRSSPSPTKASDLPSIASSPTAGPSNGSSSSVGNTGHMDLQSQYEAVQSLRRDLAVMRQVHVDFLADTKESFSRLRAQNSSMREVVRTKMSGSRALLDNSKTKLESQCQDAIQAVEEVLDTLDAAREDALRRFVSPSRAQMTSIRADLDKASALVEQVTRDVASADPTWRATWAFELNRVMEEQKLLSYQSKLAQDLKNDIKQAVDMLQNVQDFVDQRAAMRAAGTTPSKGFRPPSPDESGGLPNLLLEIRTKEMDPNQRLKAIEAQQKARERELANRTDEFSSELQGFVSGRKLKKTGGTDEAERARQRRQEQTLKRMLTGEQGGGILTPQVTGASVKSPPATVTGGKMVSSSDSMAGTPISPTAPGTE